MDVIERPDSYVIRADAPGFDPSDINIEVHDGVITISAEHEEQRGGDRDREGRALRRERVYRSFRRSFTLPDDAKEDDIEAHMDRGVLTVTVKKEEQPKRPEPKRIQVRGAGAPSGAQQGRIGGTETSGGAGTAGGAGAGATGGAGIAAGGGGGEDRATAGGTA
jgi:HSP20 family protein